EVILPLVLALQRVEARWRKSCLRVAVVARGAGFERAGPERSKPVVARDRPGLERSEGASVEIRTGVELGGWLCLRVPGRELLLGREAVGHACVDAVVGVTVAVRVVAEVGRIPDRVEAGALAMSGLRDEAPRPGRARRSAREETGLVSSIARGDVRRQS